MAFSAKTYWRWWHIKRHLREATLPAHAAACPDCGQSVWLNKVSQGQTLDCPCCGHDLVRVASNPYIAPLAYAITSLVLLAMVSLTPFLGVKFFGYGQLLSLPEMMAVLTRQDVGILADVMFVLVFGTPLLFLLLCLYVFYALNTQTPAPYLTWATRSMMRLKPWIMVDVFFISVLVAMVKMQALGEVMLGPAFVLMFVLSVLLIRTMLYAPSHWLYHQIAEANAHINNSRGIACSKCLFYQDPHHSHCQVCHASLHHRRPHSLALSAAFLCAGIILYIPANVLPMMITANPMVTLSNNILDGVVVLWKGGDQLVAVIIFFASVLIPLAKILAMIMLLYSARFKPLASPLRLTQIYRMVEFVGRWSMIDVFVIIILMAMFQSPLARVLPGAAVFPFCMVVFVTMLSAYFFDIRLIWDRSPHRHTHETEPL